MIKRLLNLLLAKGLRIGVSTGKTFDPRNQKRTDAIDDIIKSDKRKRRGKHGDSGNKTKKKT